MEHVGYYNGEICALEDMKVPFLDRACYFGDGVYDATMIRDGVILYIEDHLDRFFNSMRLLRFEAPWTAEWLLGELQRVVDVAEGRDLFLYWQVSRGTGWRGHEFCGGEVNLVITVEPHPFADLALTNTAVTFEDKRFSYCNAKTLNLIPNVLAAQYARDCGADVAVFVRDGIVTENAYSNIHILKDGAIATHPADEHILPGIARRHLIDQARALGIPVEERPFALDELMAADEVIETSSSCFAQRITSVDGTPVGGRDIATYERLRDALVREFEDYIESRRR